MISGNTLTQYQKSEFARNVLKLTTGTTIAHAIPIVISPILTRIYTPQEFGLLALYMAISSILAVVATARYEMAIMMPKSQEDAQSVFWLSILVSFFTCALALAMVLLIGADLADFIGNPELEKWLYLIPVTVLLTGIYQSLNYWNTRCKHFSDISKSKIAQSTATVCGQLSVAGTPYTSYGLIGGHTVGQLIGVVFLTNKAVVEKKNDVKKPVFTNVYQVAKRYKKFPLISTWGTLFDKAGQQLPVFVLTKYFSAYITGQFSLVYRVLSLPSSLIGSSIAQVLFQKIVEIHQQRPEDLYSYIVKLFFILLFSAAPMVIVFYCWGEPIFTFVFGEAWREAGSLAAILSIAIAFRFAVSPLSMVLHMDHNLKLGALWQSTYFVTLTITLLWASQYNITQFIQIFVIHELVLYSLYLSLILAGSRKVALA